MYKLQLYCSKFLGNHHIMSAGSDQNMLKILNKQTLEVVFFIAFMLKKTRFALVVNRNV